MKARKHPDDGRHIVFYCFFCYQATCDSPLAHRGHAAPVPGCRGYEQGMVRNVGRNGYSYSSSMTESYGYFLDLRYSEIGPNNNSSRAFGLQTRCLQE